MRLFVLLLFFFGLIGGPAPSAAQTVNQTGSQVEYVIKLRGLTVGTLRLTTDRNGAGYAASAWIENAGLVGSIRPFHFQGASAGSIHDGPPVPDRYAETADTGRRTSEVEIEYAGGVPRVTHYTSTTGWGDDSPDPATQGDATDPVTALFVLLRDQPMAGICDTTLRMFDGKRRSQLVLGPAVPVGAEFRCTGEYRRLLGFTAKEISRHTAFPFQVSYAPGGDGLVHVTRIAVISVYGLATLDRR